jgi:hypothetical protein
LIAVHEYLWIEGTWLNLYKKKALVMQNDQLN